MLQNLAYACISEMSVPGRRMRRAIIHIGTMKTGTTSIQRVLRKYRPALVPQGACYARTPGILAHVKLVGLLAHRKAASLGHAAPSVNPGLEIENFPAAFDHEMKHLPASIDRVIFSEERLSLSRNEGDIEPLKEFLQPYFDAFTIVVYLRSQDSYLASRYSELLRMRVFDGPDHVVATPERLMHHDYEALVARWRAVFGEDAMQVRLYERGSGKNFDSVDDFLGVCNVALDVPADDPARSRNESMSFAGQQLMLRMAALIQEKNGGARIDEAIWTEIRKAINAAAPGQGWLPTQAEAAVFMQRFEAGNERLKQRYFPDRPRLFADGSGRFPQAPMQADEAAILNVACQAFLKGAARAEMLAQTSPEPRGANRGKGKRGGKGRRRAAQEDDVRGHES